MKISATHARLSQPQYWSILLINVPSTSKTGDTINELKSLTEVVGDAAGGHIRAFEMREDVGGGLVLGRDGWDQDYEHTKLPNRFHMAEVPLSQPVTRVEVQLSSPCRNRMPAASAPVS